MVICDDAFIQDLNAQWRGEDVPTDVLSFPLFEPGDPIPPGSALGDLVLNLEYAERLVATSDHTRRVAGELGVAPEELAWGLEEEIHFLLIHGLLHLVGHDHAEDEEETRMRALEATLWRASLSGEEE